MKKAFKAILAMILCFSLCFCALALTSCDDDKSDADTSDEEKADKEEKDNKDNKDDKKETDSGDKTDDNGTDRTDNNGDATDGADEVVSIVVAKNDVAKGSRITSKDVELVEIHPEALAADHLTGRCDAIGKYAVEAISKGETIKTSMISGTPAGVGGSGNGSATVDPSALGYVVITDYVQPNTGRDVSAQIQKAIDENPQKTIYFPDGEYILGEPIKTSIFPTSQSSKPQTDGITEKQWFVLAEQSRAITFTSPEATITLWVESSTVTELPPVFLSRADAKRL